MIKNKHAGISCDNCGYEVAVKSESERKELESALRWDNGDPVCPECNKHVWFEDYLD